MYIVADCPDRFPPPLLFQDSFDCEANHDYDNADDDDDIDNNDYGDYDDGDAYGDGDNDGVGRGGSLVDSSPFVRRIVGLNHALAAT